jgi:hypothetical protein
MFRAPPFDGRPIGPDDGQAGSNPKVRFADYTLKWISAAKCTNDIRRP